MQKTSFRSGVTAVCRYFDKLSSERDDEECDATGDDSSSSSSLHCSRQNKNKQKKPLIIQGL